MTIGELNGSVTEEGGNCPVPVGGESPTLTGGTAGDWRRHRGRGGAGGQGDETWEVPEPAEYAAPTLRPMLGGRQVGLKQGRVREELDGSPHLALLCEGIFTIVTSKCVS